MNKTNKAVQKFLKQPESLRYPEIEKILKLYGFELIKAKGSHKKFKHQSLTTDLIIPVHNNDCKDFYKRLTAKTIKSLPNVKTLHHNQQ